MTSYVIFWRHYQVKITAKHHLTTDVAHPKVFLRYVNFCCAEVQSINIFSFYHYVWIYTFKLKATFGRKQNLTMLIWILMSWRHRYVNIHELHVMSWVNWVFISWCHRNIEKPKYPLSHSRFAVWGERI